MQLSVNFKNVDPSDNLKSYLQEKLDRLDKLFDNPADANVSLSVQKHRHIAEVNINADRLTIIGKEDTTDMYSAIDMVTDKLEKQIKRGKQKNRSHRNSSRARTMDMLSGEAEPVIDEDQSKEIFVKNIEYKPMDVDEAAMQMDLVSDSFLVFTNSKTERVNVIYRRNDGHFGLIQPSD
jgi:putative sigma-54 modulation protein